MIKTQVCEHCKSKFDFDTRHGLGKYCSSACSTKGKNKIAEHHDTVLQLFAEGQTYEEIARSIGHSGKRVKHYFMINNMPLRSRSDAMKLTRKKHPSYFQLRPMRGKENPTWKGGKTVNKSGYILSLNPSHPRASPAGYVFEHILIWEQVHNKSLPNRWIVHHLNGIKTDNRPCNLIAMPNKKHLNILSEKARRIRELEAENHLLRNALEKSQSIFVLAEN